MSVVDFRALDMAQEPEIGSRVERLIGPPMAIFGTKFIPNLLGVGTSVNWHQDYVYFNTGSGQIISCANCLEESDQSNDCLRVIPGSHKQGITEHDRSGPVDGKGYKVEIDESKAVDVVCPGGTVVLFSANMLHGTNDNEPDESSGKSRYSTAWNYVKPDVDLPPYGSGSYADWHVLS